MVDPEVRKQVFDGNAHAESLTVIVNWLKAPSPTLFEAASSRRERTEILSEFYRHLKEPIFSALRGDETVQVKDLPLSGTAIVTASPGNLAKLVGDGGLLARSPDVEVSSNSRFSVVNPV
jgi:hypothetical protein